MSWWRASTQEKSFSKVYPPTSTNTSSSLRHLVDLLKLLSFGRTKTKICVCFYHTTRLRTKLQASKMKLSKHHENGGGFALRPRREGGEGERDFRARWWFQNLEWTKTIVSPITSHIYTKHAWHVEEQHGKVSMHAFTFSTTNRPFMHIYICNP